MSMTREERDTKEYIQNKLAKQGYPTYASILGDFDLNLTRDPNTVGFMEPGKGRIVLNRGLDENQVSVIIRHEILHQFLEHERRLLKHLADEHNLDFDKVDDNSLNDLKRKLYSDDLFNVAADYEISNRGYTEDDKEDIRNILLNGQILTGLVTEDDHPDWVDLSVEEMYDKLREDRQNQSQDQDSGDQQSDDSNDQGSSQQSDSSQSQSSSSSSQDDSSQDDKSDSDSSDSSQNQQSDDSSNNDNSQSDSDESKDGETDSQLGNNSSSSDSSQNQQSDDSSDQSDSSSSSQSNDSSNDDNSDTSSQSSLGNNKAKGKPQIGQKGDEDTLAKEDAEREAQAKAEADEYGDIEEDDLSKEERLERIARSFEDSETSKAAQGEASDKIYKERAERAAKDAKKYRSSPIRRFTDNLNRFIKSEVGKERVRTWKKTDPRYGTGPIIRKGKMRTSNGKIPVINVYFDRSGSWDASKTKVGQDAIGTLNNYVRNGQIKINLYYFNTSIHSEDPGGRGGTRGTPIIDHIKQTKPDNVIIMTDDDIGDISESVTVPGAVWLLFKGGQSKNLIDHIHGKKQTNIYNLD